MSTTTTLNNQNQSTSSNISNNVVGSTGSSSSSSSSSNQQQTTSSNNAPPLSNSMLQNSPSSSMFLVVNPLPSNDDELNDKILETVEKLRSQTNSNNVGCGNVPVINFPGPLPIQNESSSYGDNKNQTKQSTSSPTNNQTVLQCVISRNHVAVLLDDHRVCRFPFTIYAERLNSNGQTESSAIGSKKCIYTPAVNTSSGTSGTSNSGGSSSPRSIPSRRRLVRRGGNRSSASVIMGRNTMIPAQYVPEDLVNQAQVVLQGKSRNVIIRELQRTNLDVNSAVNNLLSRDDEDFDDADDSPDHLIHSDDLMSLLDSGFHNDHSVIIDPDFTEEVLSYPLRIRGSGFFPHGSSGGGSNNQSGSNSSVNNASTTATASNNNVGNTSSSTSSNTRNPYLFMERDLNLSANGQPNKRWFPLSAESPKNLDASQSSRSKKKTDPIQLSPISFTDHQEYWLGSNDRKFIHIASMHSELIAITTNGHLCQWRWQDAEPFKSQTNEGIVYYHPRVPSLGLLTEKMSLLSASVIRATVVTETNKIATWLDETLAIIASKLEHSASNFNEAFSAGCSGPFKITSLYVSSLMSCVQLSSGTLFWWGTPPFSHRKKMAEKGQNERSKTKPKSSTSTSPSAATKNNEIVQGTLVCMRNAPIYQCGAIGFTTVGGVPKVGSLVGAAWKLAETYSFRVITQQEITQHSRSYSGSSISSVPSTLAASLNSSKNLERSEMPPPPSPASSTSSESSNTNTTTSLKRARRTAPCTTQLTTNQQLFEDGLPKERTESWNLRDVVFVDDIKSMPVGRVIKVDGNFVAVKFQNNPPMDSNVVNNSNKNLIQSDPQQLSASSRISQVMSSGGTGNDIESYYQDCRLLRKEDLIVVRASGSSNASTTSCLTLPNPAVGNKIYDHFQRTPKRVPIAEHMQILAMTLTNLGLHVIAKIGGYRLSYLQINIVTGRIEHDNKLSIEYSTFFGSGTNPKSLIRLFSAGENEQTTVVLCRDGNGTLYPLAKDCTNMIIREPIALNLGPVSSVGLGVFSLPNINGGITLSSSSSSSSSVQHSKFTHAAILALTLDRQYLMPAILNCDLDLVRECLSMLNAYPNLFYSMISEVCDGNHNIIHIAVSACFPTSNRRPATNESVQIHVQVMDEDDVDLSTSMLNDTNDNSSDATNQQSFTENTEPLLDPNEQKPIAHSILWTLLDSPALSRHLFDLLSARDYQGLTPFMLAISGRAYSAAQQIFVVMQRVARIIASNNESNSNDSTTHDIYQRAFIQMLYPRGSSPDHSPLYMLCSNDTCSFTWTGDNHINQDIFECRTCGLVGSLCCCTECARVCHRGHDCKLKRTSPTAYCDCWEKCKCKTLIAGCQPARYSLLKRLLTCTDLSQRVNSRGEHILLFLVQTVGRQIIEQKQFRPTRSARSSFSNSNNCRTKNEVTDEQSNVPEHDLEPPKFARRVLEKMLGDWPTVKSMILTGYRSSENNANQRRRSYLWNLNGTANTYSYEEENSYLSCQNGSALLDKFTHSLLKIDLNDAIYRITSTIVHACRNQTTTQEGQIVARRFVRSVIRVSMAFLFETNPVQYSMAYLPFGSVPYSAYIERYLSVSQFGTSGLPSSSLTKKSNILTMMRKFRRIFIALLPITCEELCEMAESLIAPVKLGLARPSSSFMMLPTNNANASNSNNNESTSGSITDELFSVDTSVFSHQRDFLDATFGLNDMMDEPSAQDNLPPPSSHMIWNSYESTSNTPSEMAAGSAASTSSVRNNSNSNKRQNEENISQQQAQGQDDSNNRSDSNQNATHGNDVEMNIANDTNSNTSTSQPIIYDLTHSSSNESPRVDASTSNVPNASNSTNGSPDIIIDRPTNEENSNMESNSDHHNSTSDADVMVMEMLVANSEPDDNSNVGNRDTESDSESNPDDASYLSNADNASAQRSVVTGATAGSDVGVASLPYDDESLNSNPDDVDDDDDDEQDEQDEDDSSDSDDASDTAETEPDTDILSSFMNVESVDRRIAGANSSNATSVGAGNSNSSRHNILQHVQWALRNQQLPQFSNSGSNAQDSSSFRRNLISSALVSSDNILQISNSMVGLARSFSIITRHIADLLVIIRDIPVHMVHVEFPHLCIGTNESKILLQTVEDRMRNTWNWLINCMDSTETQLRFGCALSNRRLAPSASSSSSNSPSASNQTSGSANTSVANSSSNLLGSTMRLSRLRTFQSQDEMAMLPTFNRSNLRRHHGSTYLFTRTSANSTNANSSSNANPANNAGGNASNNASSNEVNQAAHRDFLNYAMSLMRAHSNEHYDSLPALDVSSLKHVAYIFDAFVYFIRRGFFNDSRTDFLSLISPQDNFSSQEMIRGREEFIGRNHPFFRRSNSTLYLGCPRPDPFSAPYHEALPLASKPQLLQPNARREQLFGIPRPSNANEAEEMLETLPSQMSLTKRHQWNYHVRTIPSSPTSFNSSLANNPQQQSPTTPTRNQSVITESPSRVPIIQQPNKLSVIVMAGSAKHHQQQQSTSSSNTLSSANHIVSDHNYGTKPPNSSAVKLLNTTAFQKVNFFGNVQQQDILLGRWRLTLELFGRLFVDDVSLEPNSIIHELSGFPIKESKFRREMERLRISCSSSSSTQRDLNFYKLDRDRNALLIQTFKELNSVFSCVTRRLTSQTTIVGQPLTITRVKVTFKDEPGEGAGVARSFYTAFSEAVLANEKLPPELLMSNNSSGISSGRHSTGSVSGNYENLSGYVFRLRSYSNSNNAIHNSNNANNNNSNTGQRVASSGSSSSAPNSSSPVNDNSAAMNSMRRPRSPARYGRPFYSNSARRTHLIERIRNMGEQRLSSSSSGLGSSTSSLFRRMPTLRYDAPSFVPSHLNSRNASVMVSDPRNTLGARLYNRVVAQYPSHASKITGMLMEIHSELLSVMHNEDDLRNYIDYAMEIIQNNEGTRASINSGSNSSTSGLSSAPQNASNNAIITMPPSSEFISLINNAEESSQNQQQQSQSQDRPTLSTFLTASDLVYEAFSNVSNSKYKSSATISDGSSLQLDYSDDDDNAPLFYQPGIRGFYSPRNGRACDNRLNAFRNVGRIIGVCFVQNELCPITFNRHVIKIILGQSVAWHDLAFFDSELYESLRQLILDAESNNKEEIFSECDFRFAIDLPSEEGSHEIELIPNGRNIRVTPQNVYDYVRRYALYRMVDSQEKAILAIRAGIFDVIPQSSFDGLTPEDFRLLLNGVNEINVQQLQTYVTFYDESGDPDPMTNFRKWFWWVVERMTNEEKQDLIYFWTGSPALPASEEGFQPMPSVTIRPRDDYYFVTANTCISRLYIPIYSSRNILRQKLLMSIKSKSFDFI